MSKKFAFTVGICAFNEEQNIGRLIENTLSQKLPRDFIMKKIIVVSSGSTDKTEEVIKKIARKNKRVTLLVQKERLGKASAVNLFLKRSTTKALILQSADIMLGQNCFKYLLRELFKEKVGLVAGKIVPKDNKNTFLGFANNLKWELHHRINMVNKERPKVGELIAFKKIFEQIPPETAVDEASIEPLIHLQGFKIIYQPKAIIYNQGPKTLREYLSQRRRIYAGHFVTKKKYAYEVTTLDPIRIIPVFFKNIPYKPKELIYSLSVVLLEILARTVGYLDIKYKLRNQTVWKIAKTTKTFDQ